MKKKVTVFTMILILVVSLFQPAGSLSSIQAAAPKLNKSKITLNAGKTKQLKVKNAKGSIKWSTASKKIATVSKKGVVKGKKEGKTTITAAVSGKKLKCVVTVKAAISEKRLTLYPGGSKKLKVTGAAKKVKWSTSKKQVATVSKKGVVKAKKIGTAVITAKYGKKKLTCKVTVQKKPAVTPAGGSIEVKFTNSGQQTAADSATNKTFTYVETMAESLNMTGTVTASNTTITSLSYQVMSSSNKMTESGSLTPGSSFAFAIKPTVGINTVIVTAADSAGRKGTGSICVVRRAANNTLSESVHVGDPSDADNLGRSVAKVFVKVETIGGRTQEFTHIIISRSSELAGQVAGGMLKPGDIYCLPQTEALPTGYTGLFVTAVSPTDPDFPSSQYVEVIFREPSITELYTESGNIEINAINTSDPIAFVLAPDGTDLMDPSAVASVGASDSGETYSKNYFPEGFLKAVDVKASVSGGKVSMSLEMNDLIVYDDDGKKSTKDQVTLSGSVGVQDLTVDEKIDWSWGSLNQIYFQESYTNTASAKLDFYAAKMNLKNLVKNANGGFENSVSIAGAKLAGVDMSNRLFLGVIGINAQGRVPAKDINGLQVASVEPLILIALYLDLDGSLSVDSSLTITNSAYHENVTNIVKNGYSSPKHYTNSAYQSTVSKGGYTIYKAEHTWKSASQHTEPEPVIKLATEGKASMEIGIGAMIGIMAEGIVPLDVYAQAYGKGEGSLKGTLEVRPTTEQEEMRLRTDVQAEIHFEAGVEVGYEARVCLTTDLIFLDNLEVSVDGSATKKFLDKSLIIPYYNAEGYVWGTLSPITFDEQVLTGATLYFYDKESLGVENDEDITPALLSSKKESVKTTTNGNGYFMARGLKHRNYVLRIDCPNYDTLIEKELFFSGDQNKDYHLRHMRDENWLDICQPSEYNNDRHDLFIGDDPNGKMKISGVEYYIGFFLNSGNQGDGDTADATFSLDGKFQSLQVRIGHVDNTQKLNADLNIYLDGAEEPNQTINLSCQTASNVYLIDLNGAQTARFSLKKTEWDNWDTSSYGFVEGVWTTSDGSKRGTAVYADPFQDVDMSGSWLNVCAPFSYTSMTLATEAKPVSAGDYSTANGFKLTTQSVLESHGPHAVFNTFGKFSALQLTICGSYNNMKVYVYLDDDTEARQEIAVTKEQKSINIPLYHANSLRLQVKNDHDNWTTYGCVFGDGTWIP